MEGGVMDVFEVKKGRFDGQVFRFDNGGMCYGHIRGEDEVKKTSFTHITQAYCF